MLSANVAAVLYLVSAVLFIMALRGLSSPETARGGNLFGIVGMVIAIGTTLASPGVVSYPLIVLGVLIGGAIGTFIALRIQMTALPQLVAAFHSLVGLAAVCVAAAAFYDPSAYGIGAAAEAAFLGYVIVFGRRAAALGATPDMEFAPDSVPVAG